MQVSVLSRRATSFTVTTSKLVSRDLVSHLIWPHIEGEHAVYEYNVRQITQSHIIHQVCGGGGVHWPNITVNSILLQILRTKFESSPGSLYSVLVNLQ